MFASGVLAENTVSQPLTVYEERAHSVQVWEWIQAENNLTPCIIQVC